MKCVLLQVSGERKRNGTLGRNGIETKVQLAIITAKINDRNKIKYTIIRANKGRKTFCRIHGEVFQTFVEYRMVELILVDSMH